MRISRKFISLLLCLAMVLSMMPVEVFAWDEVVECEFCGRTIGDDWICSDHGDHCGPDASGDCYENNHCEGCGNHKGDDVDFCEECNLCYDCGGMCSEGTDHACLACHEEWGVMYCPDCYKCYDAHDDEFCFGGCGKCNDCGDTEFCEDCGYHIGCTGNDNDHCEGCGKCYQEHYDEFCAGDCFTCFDCWDDYCEECGYHYGCTSTPHCEECSACGESVYICDDCGLCPDCFSHCANCGSDESLVTVCPECGLYCEECCNYCYEYDMCEFCAMEQGYHCASCGSCDQDVMLCSECGEFCSDCDPWFCYECEVCNECAWQQRYHCVTCGSCGSEAMICAECNEVCAYCDPYFCEECEMCIDCALYDSYHCNNCWSCGQEVEICEGCGAVCSDCADWCENCELCYDCAVSFDMHCPNCESCRADVTICEICEEVCSDCAEWDDYYDICMECAADLGYFCPTCGTSLNDAILCVVCEEVCSECYADFCEWHEMCMDCGIAEGLHCGYCGLCEADTGICPNCGERCSECDDEWCESCDIYCMDCLIEMGMHCPICHVCYDEVDKCDTGDHCVYCCDCSTPDTLYEVWVNGRQFNSDNLIFNCGGGTAAYNPETNTLTLDGAQITHSSGYGAIYSNGPLTVEVISDSSIKLNSSTPAKGIYTVGNLILTGSANLEIITEAAACTGLYTEYGDITVNMDGNLTIDATSHGISADFHIELSGSGDVTIHAKDFGLYSRTVTLNKSGNVAIRAESDGIYADYEITLAGSGKISITSFSFGIFTRHNVTFAGSDAVMIYGQRQGIYLRGANTKVLLNGTASPISLSSAAGLAVYNKDTGTSPVEGTSLSLYNVSGSPDSTKVVYTLKVVNYKVSFNMNGHGSQIAEQTVKKGEKAVKPADPTASGYTFSGWYADSACTTAFDFNTPINGNTTIYAKWTKNPAAPKVAAACVASSGYPKLSWDKVDGALSYNVYRATSKTGTYKLMKNTTNLSYTNTSAVAGTTYYYKVVAVGENGARSEESAIKTVTCDLAQPVVKATNVASTGYNKLTWEAIPGATAYKVYRSTSKTGTFTLMKTVKDGATSYVNSNAVAGTTYYYYVVAVMDGKDAATSAPSEIKISTCDLAQPVVKATNVASTGYNKLTWEAVPGATAYKVYRSTSRSGTYTLMKTVRDGATSYVNTNAVSGTTYYYYVVAVMDGKDAATSAKSEIKVSTCDLPQPTMTLTAGTGKITVKWDKVEKATGYKIYRATSKDGTYTLVKTITSGDTVSWSNTGLTAGKKYYYKMVAILDGKDAATSAYSAVKYTTVK